MVKETAFAKINLGIEVGASRPDGFHDMNSLILPIDLTDILEFEEMDSGILLIDNTDIKTTDNFVYKAAKLFMEHFQIQKGVRITLYKRIPSQAGLGGGSSDAAACLRGLNHLFDVGASLETLAELAAKLGSDMPYCVYSKLSYCTGRGELVEPLDIEYPRIPVCIIKPPYGLSTKAVYTEFKFTTVNVHKEQFEKIKEALASSDLELLDEALFNDLEAPAFSLKAELKELKERIEALGYVCRMSGSGTALFAFSKTGSFAGLKEALPFHTIIETKLA